MDSAMRDLTGIATLLIAVAFTALLIGHSNGTVQIIKGAGGVLNTLLNTVELNGGGSSSLGAGFGASGFYGG